MENKYIEAFENIIFQKRDNGYISDAYRNDIDVVYEALYKLEKLKIEEVELINNNENKREETYKIFVGDVNPGSDHTSPKTVEESISKIQKIKEEKSSLQALSDIRFDMSMSQDINYKEANDNCDIVEKTLKALLKFASDDLVLYTTTEGEFVVASYETYLLDLEYVGSRNIPLSKEEYNLVKETLEEYGKKLCYIKKIKEKKNMKNNNNELLLQEQQNKAMEIIFNKCRDNVNLLLVNRNHNYDEYNSAFEYQMRTNVFNLKEEDKLTIDEFIDIYEWLETERIKNGLKTVVEKGVDVTKGGMK